MVRDCAEPAEPAAPAEPDVEPPVDLESAAHPERAAEASATTTAAHITGENILLLVMSLPLVASFTWANRATRLEMNPSERRSYTSCENSSPASHLGSLQDRTTVQVSEVQSGRLRGLAGESFSHREQVDTQQIPCRSTDQNNSGIEDCGQNQD